MKLKECICTIYIFLWRYRLSFGLCKGNNSGCRCERIYSYEPCCVGEIFNSTEGKCMPCPWGYFGENCTLSCNIPEYGYRCPTGKCTCNSVSCKIRKPGECLTLAETATKNTSERTTIKRYPSYITQQITNTMFYNLSTEMFLRKTNIINATLSNNQTSPDKDDNVPYTIMLCLCGVISICAVIVECVIIVRKKINKGDLENGQQISEPIYSVITIRNE